MREEIEAAALFITKLVNKNLSQSNSTGCSSASSTHSSSSSSSTSSESPPGFDEQTTTVHDDKVEQFKQCLTKALYERFHNHWFPEQPTKGQAYRCIRLNEWDRHDITLLKACSQCGIDYKDLQLPVELTLWVDPDEVTCRFGENKGSHCLVAKFKDGELKDNNFNIDINNIDIEIFRQTTIERMRQLSLQSPDQNGKQHIQHNVNNNIHHNNNHGSYLHNNSHHYQQAQHQQQQQQQQQQQTPQQHHHRSNLGKAAVLPSYHHNYLNGCVNTGNPIPYYF